MTLRSVSISVGVHATKHQHKNYSRDEMRTTWLLEWLTPAMPVADRDRHGRTGRQKLSEPNRANTAEN
jgi:hypothetical protein